MNVRITATPADGGPSAVKTVRAEDLPPWVGHLLEAARSVTVDYGDSTVTYTPADNV